MDSLDVVNKISSIVWGPALIFLMLGVGFFYSIATRFVQVRQFKEMLRLLRLGSSSDKGISSFQALAMALSGRVGTGNIAGVAAAIGFGGPGAIFWMWMVAFLGSASAFIEATLAQIYKEEHNGIYRGGPAYYFEKALGQKWFALFFSCSLALAFGLLLPSVQANNIGNAVESAFGSGQLVNIKIASLHLGKYHLSKLITLGLLLVLLVFIIFGGVKRIAQVSQYVVPFMALGYIFVSCIVIAINYEQLPAVFSLIISDAFNPMAGFGAAIGWGVKRGVYSNEAGQGGIGPHAAASAEVEHPAQQGISQSFTVYIDTLFVCSATAFMILITGAYNVNSEDLGLVFQNLPLDVVANSPAFTQIALDRAIPSFGKPFIAIALFFFAFTTILANYFMAETNILYIKRTFKLPSALFVLKFCIITSVSYGCLKTADLIWGIGDIAMGATAWINVTGMLMIFFIGRPAIKALRDYEKQQAQGVKNYTFDPKALGIKNATFWEERKNTFDKMNNH